MESKNLSNNINFYWLKSNNHYAIKNIENFNNYFFGFLNNVEEKIKNKIRIYDIQDINEKMNEFSQTETAQQTWQEDFSDIENETTTEPQSSSDQGFTNKAEKMTKDIFTDWLFGPISPVVS